jgi:hypothetical protein
MQAKDPLNAREEGLPSSLLPREIQHRFRPIKQ